MTQKQGTKQKKRRNVAEHAIAIANAGKQTVGSRGRTFEGFVTKKFSTRVVVEFERTVYVRKYQRFYKKKTRLHARLPAGVPVEVGDYIRVRECRPLSKIIRFVAIEKIRSANEMAGAQALASVNEKKEAMKGAKA